MSPQPPAQPLDPDPEQAPVEPIVAEVAETAVALSPVSPSHRIDSIDTLRGFALMGILVVNIQAFALSGFQDLDPRMGADFTGWNYVAWWVTRLFFHSKMYPIFSMLFGAGLVLMDQRANERHQRLGGLYYRRLFWLLAIGLIHAYFIWEGDILVAYAMCGAMLYPFRRMSAKVLVPLGLIGYSVLPVAALGLGELASWMEASAAAADQAGEQATEFQSAMQAIRDTLETELKGSPEQLEEEQATYRGGYWQLFRHRAPLAIGVQFAFVFILNWGFLGVMMIGVALMKAGVFSASRSRAFYIKLLALGYGVGLPMVGFTLYDAITHDFAFTRSARGPFQLFAFGSLVVALGHVGLVMTVCKLPLGQSVLQPLGAAGRMALTNYLCQSLTCGVLFFGWGFGLFGHLGRIDLVWIILVIWSVQLVGSSIWLRFFCYGPAEWVWRSLTYRRSQPFRL